MQSVSYSIKYTGPRKALWWSIEKADEAYAVAKAAMKAKAPTVQFGTGTFNPKFLRDLAKNVRKDMTSPIWRMGAHRVRSNEDQACVQ